MSLPTCHDCGGFDVEWMYRCHKHGTDYCRGCSCPCCDEEAADDDYEVDEEGIVHPLTSETGAES